MSENPTNHAEPVGANETATKATPDITKEDTKPAVSATEGDVDAGAAALSRDEATPKDLGSSESVIKEPLESPELTINQDKLASRATLELGPTTEDDPAETRRLLRKIDYQVLPAALVLYATSFMDRSAIGNARIGGLQKDLRLTDGQYAFATSIFFVFYALFEVPANVGLRRFGARRWLPALAFLWGFCQMMTAFVHSFAALSVLRVLLGVFEAGILPGTMAMMSFLYPPSAVQSRYGVLTACNIIFVSFGGLLAYGVCHIKSGHFPGWRWLFVIQGLITTAVAIPSYWGLTSSLDEARLLTPSEKAYLKDRIQWDKGRREMLETGRARYKHVWTAIKDLKIWLFTLAFFGHTGASYSLALALPSLLRMKLHYSVVTSQLLTVPVYVVTAIFVLTTSILSDRTNKRALVVVCSALLSAFGWSLGYRSHNPHEQYFAFFLAGSGSFSVLPSIVALISQNLAGQTKRATGMAIVISVGGLGSIVASNTAPSSAAPQFTLAYRLNIAGCLATAAGTSLMVLYLKRANRLKAQRREELQASNIVLSQEELDELGDESPYFVYRY